MIDQWKRALLDGASGVFERGGRKVPVIDEDQVRDLHAKIGGFCRKFCWNLSAGIART